jgi:hypothetical protein
MLRQRRVSAVAAALLTGLLAGSAVLPAFAQDATQAPAAPAAPAPAAAAPAATAAEPPAEQVAIAVQFLRASGLTAGFDDMIPQFMQQANAVYANQRPELATMINQATIELVPEFMKERADLDQGLAKLYITKFSQDELKQLTAFYQTPVGQKFSREQQTIIRDSVPVVQEWTRKLQGDIMTRIKDEVGKKGGKL